jgi:hypothetical protein
MDYATGYYGGSPLIGLANATMTVALMLLLGALFIKVENKSLPHARRGIFSRVTACILAVALLLVASSLISYVTSNLPIFSFRAILSHRSFVVAILTAVLAVSGAAYAVISAFISEEKKILIAFFEIAAALFFGIYAGFTFFRFGDSINQPQKIATEMAMLAVAIFLLEDTRILLGRERRSSYFVCGIIASALSSYAAFPALSVLIARGRLIAFSLAEMLLMLAVLCFIACKLILMAIAIKSTPLNSCAEEESHTDETSQEEAILQISIEELSVQEESEISYEEDTGN